MLSGWQRAITLIINVEVNKTMNDLTEVNLRAPYLIFIGDVKEKLYAKTGLGIIQWRHELVAGQLRFPGCLVDMGVPDMSIEDAVRAGVKSLIIGVAPIGGNIPDVWWKTIEKAAMAGLDIVCGLHLKLAEVSAIAAAAEKSGARLIDVRNPPKNIPVGSGKKRQGKRLLMVGTDCGVGKKYSALALEPAMNNRGLKSTFRATGQTGIMIAGVGVPIDTVVADFISGTAELVSPDNDPDHWDVIEGQGSLFHPGYAGVSLGLLHGSQPDAIVVCHDPSREHMGGMPDYSMPTVRDCIDRNILEGQLTNPAIQCVGVCVNTSMLSDQERESYLRKLANEVNLPCVDPLIQGCDEIVTQIKNKFDC